MREDGYRAVVAGPEATRESARFHLLSQDGLPNLDISQTAGRRGAGTRACRVETRLDTLSRL